MSHIIHFMIYHWWFSTLGDNIECWKHWETLDDVCKKKRKMDSNCDFASCRVIGTLLGDSWKETIHFEVTRLNMQLCYIWHVYLLFIKEIESVIWISTTLSKIDITSLLDSKDILRVWSYNVSSEATHAISKHRETVKSYFTIYRYISTGSKFRVWTSNCITPRDSMGVMSKSIIIHMDTGI